MCVIIDHIVSSRWYCRINVLNPRGIDVLVLNVCLGDVTMLSPSVKLPIEEARG